MLVIINYPFKLPGPSCSKLTMSLVTVSLKLWSLNMTCTLIFFAEKMWVAFTFAICICKSYSHFSSKNTCELDIVLTRKVNILTTNELVKLTMLWTTGPRKLLLNNRTDAWANRADTDQTYKMVWSRSTLYTSISTFRHITSKHYENMPIQIYWKFYHQKMKIFR